MPEGSSACTKTFRIDLLIPDLRATGTCEVLHYLPLFSDKTTCRRTRLSAMSEVPILNLSKPPLRSACLTTSKGIKMHPSEFWLQLPAELKLLLACSQVLHPLMHHTQSLALHQHVAATPKAVARTQMRQARAQGRLVT